MNALLAALEGKARAPALDLDGMNALSVYWENVRELYYVFESGLNASTAEVYEHEIPGGQYSNLRPRAIRLGLGERWEEIKQKYRDVNEALGDLIKVTPTSKVVADFAMFLVQNDLSVDDAITQAERLDFPQSVTDFLAGKLGQPYGGFPKRLQKAVLKGRPAITDRAGEHLEPHDFEAATKRLSERLDRAPTESELLSDALYPDVFDDYLRHRDVFGDVSILPTPAFLYGLNVGEEVSVDIEPGKTIIVKLVAIGGVTSEGQRMVYFEMNGQPREVVVRDETAAATVDERPMADPADPFDVGASMPGKVLEIVRQVGEAIDPGDPLLVLEAMKMETAVTAPTRGVIERIHVSVGDDAKAGELLVRLRNPD